MGIVFINYRRSETAGEARALHQELSEMLGAGSVFMDVDDIALGQDFRQALAERLDACDVMLTLIGREWADSRDAAGQRRLDNPADFVRIEIATALHRNIAVTPVLLQGAAMPAAESLPAELRDLAFRNGYEISHARWDSDVRELVRRLGLKPHAAPLSAPAAATAPRRGLSWLIAGVVLVLAAAGAAWLFSSRPRQAGPVAPASAASTAASSDAAPIEQLMAQLDDASPDVRSTAADTLRRSYARSPLAVGLAVNQLMGANFNRLSKDGRVEVLTFLNEADDAAWSADHRAEAAQAIQRLQQTIAAGKFKPLPQVLDLIERLGRRVGA